MKLRIGIISLFSIFLSLILLGSIKEIGRDIKYPVNNILVVTNYSGKDKNKTLATVDKATKQANITIYKPFMSKKGELKTAKIGIDDEHLNELKMLPLTGIYYVKLGTDNTQFKQLLQDEKLKVQVNPLNLTLVPVITFLSGVRAPSIWTLFFVFLITIYALEMLLIKSVMIYRHVGRLSTYIVDNLKIYLSSLVVVNSAFYLVFCLINGGLFHVYSRILGLMLLIMSVMMALMLCLANSLVALLVKLTDIASILKNRYINQFGALIYLISILVSIIIFTLSAKSIVGSVNALKRYHQDLTQWKVIKNYVKPNFNMDNSDYIDENHMVDHDWFLSQTKDSLRYLQSFNNDQTLVYMSPSDFDAGKEAAYKNKIEHPLVTDSKLAAKMIYVSSGFIQLNQKLYPQNNYGKKQDNSLVTLYIPKKLEKDVALIKNNVLADSFAYQKIASDQVQHIIIPDGQKTFLFDQEVPYDNHFPKQVVTDRILVDINQNMVPIDDNVLAFGSEVIFSPFQNSLVKNTVLLPRLKQLKLENQLLSVDLVSQNAEIKAKNMMSQIQGGILVLLGVLISSLFIIWEYLKNQYQQHAKQLLITYLFTGHKSRAELLILSPLLLGIGGVSLYSSFLIKDRRLALLVCTIYIVEVVVIAIIHQLVLKKRRVKLMKDALL